MVSVRKKTTAKKATKKQATGKQPKATSKATKPNAKTTKKRQAATTTTSKRGLRTSTKTGQRSTTPKTKTKASTRKYTKKTTPTSPVGSNPISHRPLPPRMQVNMRPETLAMAEELLTLIRTRSVQRDAKASEMFDALVGMLYEARQALQLDLLPRRGRWGTPAARAFTEALGLLFKAAIRGDRLPSPALEVQPVPFQDPEPTPSDEPIPG